MTLQSDFKTCRRCKEVRARDLFCRDKRSADGLQPRCKPCAAEYKRAHRLAHPEKVRAAEKRQRLANPAAEARRLEKALQWGRDNPERAKAIKRAWYERARVDPEYIARAKARQITTAGEKREYDRQYRKARADIIEQYKLAWRTANPDRVREIKANWKRRNPDLVNKWAAKRARQVRRGTPRWLTEEHFAQMAAIYTEARKRGPGWHVDHIVPIFGKNVCGLHVPWNLCIIPQAENQTKNNKLIEDLAIAPLAA